MDPAATTTWRPRPAPRVRGITPTITRGMSHVRTMRGVTPAIMGDIRNMIDLIATDLVVVFAAQDSIAVLVAKRTQIPRMSVSRASRVWAEVSMSWTISA